MSTSDQNRILIIMLTHKIECYHKDVHMFIVMYIICTVIKTMLKQCNIYRRLCIYICPMYSQTTVQRNLNFKNARM